MPSNPQVIGALPGRPQLGQDFCEYQMQSRELREARDAGRGQDTFAGQKKNTQHSGMRRNLRHNYTAAVAARFEAALSQRDRIYGGDGPFLVQTFRGSVDRLPAVPFAGNHEFGAIRSNILGKFSDLLFASVTQPTMLSFLDQAQSVGPDSMVAKEVGRTVAVNETVHGTASAAMLFGGNLPGEGTVQSDWPGLVLRTMFPDFVQ